MSHEGTDFLYPMIEGDQTDAPSLLQDLATSADSKASSSFELQRQTLEEVRGQLGTIADAVAERFEAGARLFAFGNGGSSTDAASLAALFARPPTEQRRPLPARSLVADSSVLTALSNDVGFELVFARQLIAHAREGDIAVGLSTSGDSDNVIRAFVEGHDRGMLTVGLAGNDGGQMAVCDELDHLVIVRSQSVHRIQESQSRVAHRLWELVHERLEAPLTAATTAPSGTEVAP